MWIDPGRVRRLSVAERDVDIVPVIQARRTIREFAAVPVTDDETTTLLDAARRAPSWANIQPWDFIVVRDPLVRDQIVDLYSLTNPARSCSQHASVLIVVCARKNSSGFKNGRSVTSFEHWYLFDLGCAVENMALQAAAMGLSIVIVGSLDHRRCGEFLGVPETHQVVAALPVGRPAVEKPPTPRRALSDITHYEKF